MPGWDLYTKVKRIGSGSFGCAWLIKRKKDGMPLVCKEVNVRNVPAKEKDKIYEEVEVLRKLRHVNIIALHEAFTDTNSLYIIMEYGDAGDLDKLIKNAKGNRFKEEDILDMFTQICCGLDHVHSLRILHRDLKGANILITKKGIIKLCDFGVARVMSPDTNMALTQIGTPYYLSPEICEGKPYDAKSDVWSMGCVLYELCTLRRPFEGDGLPSLILKIVRGKFAPIPATYSRDMRHLVDLMLCVSPTERCSVEEILAQPIIQHQIKASKQKSLEQGSAAVAGQKPSASPPVMANPSRRPSPEQQSNEPAAAPHASPVTGANRPARNDVPMPRSRLYAQPMPQPGVGKPRARAKGDERGRPTIGQLQAQAPGASPPGVRVSPLGKECPPLVRRDAASPQSQNDSPANRGAVRLHRPDSARGSSKERQGDFTDAGDVKLLPKNVISALDEQATVERELAKLLGKR